MNKFSKVYVGILNSKNIDKIEQIQLVPRTCTVLLSNLNLFDLTKTQLEGIQTKNLVLIPSFDNIKKANKYKKSQIYALFVDWLLKQPIEMKFVLDNDSLLYVSHKEENWHHNYGGEFGYAISTHSGEETLFYGHSARLTNNSDKLLLKEFNGYFLENSQN